MAVLTGLFRRGGSFYIKRSRHDAARGGARGRDCIDGKDCCPALPCTLSAHHGACRCPGRISVKSPVVHALSSDTATVGLIGLSTVLLYSITPPIDHDDIHRGLQDARNLPSRERIDAEVRFDRELERALGGAEAVAEVYRSWLDASASEANQIDTSTAVKAVRWPKAADSERRVGFSKLGG